MIGEQETSVVRHKQPSHSDPDVVVSLGQAMQSHCRWSTTVRQGGLVGSQSLHPVGLVL